MSIKKEKILIFGASNPIAAAIIRFINNNYNQYDIIGMDYIEEDNKQRIHNVYMNKSSIFYPTDENYSNIKTVMIMENPQYIVDCSYQLADCDCQQFNNRTKLFDKVKKYIALIDSNNPYNITGLQLPQNLFWLKHSEIFGPRFDFGTIYNFYKQIIDGEVYLCNKGLNVNDLLFVDDLALAIVYLLNNSLLSQDNNVYNASSNNDYIDLEICTIISNLLDKKVIYKWSGNKEANKAISSDKLRKLGWTSSKIKDKIKYTTNWYKMNKWFIDNQ